jgi:hypothetical protein
MRTLRRGTPDAKEAKGRVTVNSIGTFLSDRRGAAVTDWIVLSAAIVLLGTFVTYAVMYDSGGYLMAEFEQMNQQEQEISSANLAGLGAGAANADNSKYAAE